MNEKLSDLEIQKLRAVVGMDMEESSEDALLDEESAPLPDRSVEEKPSQSVPSAQSEKTFETSPESVDTELFVKVEEHAFIGKKLSDAKGDMKVIADTISLLAKAEKLKSEAITRMEGALDKIDAEIEEIESKLIVPEGLNIPNMTLSQALASDSMQDLSSELDSLKKELAE